jgi:hypothetical protein
MVDLEGRLVYSKVFTGAEFSVEIPQSVAAGNYLLRLQVADNKEILQKTIKVLDK